MFITKFIFRYLFCLLLLSCDEFPVDDDFDAAIERALLSTTGERFEHYFLEVEPLFLLNTVNLRSNTVLGFQQNGFYAFNQLTVHDVVVRDLVNNTPFTSTVTGTIAVSGRDGIHSVLYSFPIDMEAAFWMVPVQHRPEPFRVLSSFENTPGSLILPFTGDYSTTFVKQDWRVFSVNVTSDFLLSLVLNEAETFEMFYEDEYRTFTIDGFFPTDLLPLSYMYVPLAPRSRNFFQYRNFVASFSPGAVISNITPAPIVSSFEHDPQSNTLAVYFYPHDGPYAGSVISFDVNGVRRFIRIEGVEQ